MKSEKAVSAESGGNAALLPESGVSILLVDGDSTCLAVLSKMLHRFGYKVITAKQATDVFCILREREDELDLILAEASLPDMDKYQLLETVGEISKLPIIIMSAENDENDMLGSLFKGAAFYLVKPITMNDIKNLWQFSFMKKMDTVVAGEGVSSISSDEDTDNDKGTRNHQNEKRKEPTVMDKNEMEDNDGSPILKKPKLIWTDELHNRFLQAIRVLGIDEAHPKKILQHMNVPGLKKENISSHLQKYRRSLKREQGVIEKNVKGEHNESRGASYNPSSRINAQGGLFQFPEMHLLAAPCQLDFSSQDQKNVNNCISMHSLGSANCLNHVGPGCNDHSACKYGKLVLPSNQLDFAYGCPSYAGIRITSNGELAGFHQLVNSNRENFLMGKMAFSNYIDPGFERAIQWPSSVTQQQEVKEQHLQQLLPEPFLQDQGHEIFGAEIAEIDELFDMTKASTQLFLDDLCNKVGKQP